MSAAPATAAEPLTATDAVPAKRSLLRIFKLPKKKQLILIAAALAVLLAAGGGAAVFVMKKRAASAAQAEGEDGQPAQEIEAKPVRANVKSAPTFVPLDPFTVNLADRESERYAQVGITLELTDAKAAELLKAYMPAIRNNILLALGAKTAAQLMERDGKLQLAAEIRREALRPLGYDIKADPRQPARPADDDIDDPAPIRAVHFSNFIIQ